LIYILWGPDDYSLSKKLEEIKKSSGDPEALRAGTTILEGQRLAPEELKNVCQTVPFLVEKRLVIIKGLLERFERGNRSSRRPRGKTADSQEDKHKPFIEALANIPDTTILVLIDNKMGGSNPLFKELTKAATVKSFPMLRDAQLREWVQKRVTEEKASMSPKAVNLLVRLVGSNLWIMDSEIIKLVLFAGDRRIEEEDVKDVVGYTQQTTVFTMVDAILEFKSELAEQSLQQLLQKGVSPSYLFSMLVRQARLMVRAKELKNQKRTNGDIQNILGLTSEFVLRKTLEQATRYSQQRLREVYHQLLETDLSIKTGKYDAELALSMLAGELSQRREKIPTRS